MGESSDPYRQIREARCVPRELVPDLERVLGKIKKERAIKCFRLFFGVEEDGVAYSGKVIGERLEISISTVLKLKKEVVVGLLSEPNLSPGLKFWLSKAKDSQVHFPRREKIPPPPIEEVMGKVCARFPKKTRDAVTYAFSLLSPREQAVIRASFVAKVHEDWQLAAPLDMTVKSFQRTLKQALEKMEETLSRKPEEWEGSCDFGHAFSEEGENCERCKIHIFQVPREMLRRESILRGHSQG